MKGANEYCKVFKQGEQIGRLYLHPGSHARGPTFSIYVLPEGIEVKGDAPWTADGVVEVYGITGGNPGWTETYGWLHSGEWQNDFMSILVSRRSEIHKKAVLRERSQNQKDIDAQDRVSALLASY